MRDKYSRRELLDQIVRLQPDIRNFLASKGYRPHSASRGLDDAAQAVVAMTIERLPSFNAEQGEVRPWMFGIAENYTRNDGRLHRRALARLVSNDVNDVGADMLEDELEEPLSEDPPTPPSVSPERIAYMRQLARKVAVAMTRMPEPSREVLTIVSVEEGTHELAAKRLEISPALSKKRLERARVALERETGVPRKELRAVFPFLFLGEAEQRRRWLAGLASITEIAGRGAQLLGVAALPFVLASATPVQRARTADLSLRVPQFVSAEPRSADPVTASARPPLAPPTVPAAFSIPKVAAKSTPHQVPTQADKPSGAASSAASGVPFDRTLKGRARQHVQ